MTLNVMSQQLAAACFCVLLTCGAARAAGPAQAPQTVQSDPQCSDTARTALASAVPGVDCQTAAAAVLNQRAQSARSREFLLNNDRRPGVLGPGR